MSPKKLDTYEPGDLLQILAGDDVVLIQVLGPYPDGSGWMMAEGYDEEDPNASGDYYLLRDLGGRQVVQCAETRGQIRTTEVEWLDVSVLPDGKGPFLLPNITLL